MSMNILTMSSAVSSCTMMIDQEHQRIIRALRAYGVEPTGDKATDKMKLQKIEASKDAQNAGLSNSKEENKSAREIADDPIVTDKGEGTDQLAMLNKLKLGLL